MDTMSRAAFALVVTLASITAVRYEDVALRVWAADGASK